MPKRRKPQPPSLLVLQLDSEQIERDGLDLSGVARGAAQASSFVSSRRPHVAKTTSFSSFRGAVRTLSEQGRWDVVVLIGHSNSVGLTIANDRFLPWDEVGTEIRPLRPRRMILIACHGGRSRGANALFHRLRDLRRIYACPVEVSKQLGAVFLWLVPWVMADKAPAPNTLMKLQAAIGLSLGGQLRHWMRVHDMDNPDGRLLDVVAVVANPIVKAVPGFIGRLFA